MPYPAPDNYSYNNDGIREEHLLQKIESSYLDYEDTSRKCFLIYTFL